MNQNKSILWPITCFISFFNATCHKKTINILLIFIFKKYVELNLLKIKSFINFFLKDHVDQYHQTPKYCYCWF